MSYQPPTNNLQSTERRKRGLLTLKVFSSVIPFHFAVLSLLVKVINGGVVV